MFTYNSLNSIIYLLCWGNIYSCYKNFSVSREEGIILENIFIKGSPGTGKTFLARAMAYFMGSEKKSPQEVKNQNLVKEINNIDKYINSEYVEFIQIHPSLSYEDIVYGIDIQVKGSTVLINWTYKRLAKS